MNPEEKAKAVVPKEEAVEESPKLKFQGLVDIISTFTPDLSFSEENTEYLNVVCSPNQLLELATKLKNDSKTQFDYMFCLTGMDWPEHMEVIYHLKSTTLNHSMVLKVKIETRENPKVETLCHLWQTAEFHEREVFDLYGIVFINHPDLRRIFLTDDWVGYPMRKDYVDEANIVSL